MQDVRQEIGRRRQGELSRHGRPASAASAGSGSRPAGYSEFDESDRSKVMEMLLSQERVSVPDCSRCVLHAVDGRNAVDHSTMKPFCAAVVQVIKLLYEKTFTRPAPRGADDAPHKSLTNAGAPRAQSAEPRGVAVGMNPRAAAPLGRGDALSYANVDGSSASSRLGRPSSAPHRQDNLLPPTWPGTDVSGH